MHLTDNGICASHGYPFTIQTDININNYITETNYYS